MRTQSASLTLSILIASLLAAPAGAQPVTMQFHGRTVASSFFPGGLRMTGHFTYDPRLAGTPQSSNRPILVIDIPEADTLFEFNSYLLGMRDNYQVHLPGVPAEPPVDEVLLQFYHPSFQAGGGSVVFGSTDISLFTSTQLPGVFPSLERFDAYRGVSFFYDFGWTYAQSTMTIDALSTAPPPGLVPPEVYRFTRAGGATRFWFTALSPFRYTVEYADAIGASTWTSLTNVTAKVHSFRAIVSDPAPPAAQRFYRVRKEPCGCP